MNKYWLLGLIVVISGCASERYIIDDQYVDQTQYEQDLAECKRYAEQVSTSAEAGKGAAVGAILGGAVGAIFGGSRGAAKGAGAGTVTGGAKGAGKAGAEKDKIVKNCLRGRGYQVLN